MNKIKIFILLLIHDPEYRWGMLSFLLAGLIIINLILFNFKTAWFLFACQVIVHIFLIRSWRKK